MGSSPRMAMGVAALLSFFVLMQCGVSLAGLGQCTRVQHSDVEGGKTCHETPLQQQAGANQFMCACNSSSTGLTQLNNTFVLAEADVGATTIAWFVAELKDASLSITWSSSGSTSPVHYDLEESKTVLFTNNPMPTTVSFVGSAELAPTNTSLMQFSAGYTRCVSVILGTSVALPRELNASFPTEVYLQFHVEPPFPLGEVQTMGSYVSLRDDRGTRRLGHRPAYDRTYGFSVNATCAEATAVISNMLTLNGQAAQCPTSISTDVFLAALPEQIPTINVTTITASSVAALWVPGRSGGCPITHYNVTLYRLAPGRDVPLRTDSTSDTHITLNLPGLSTFSASEMYYVAVAACTRAGCGYGSEATFRYEPHKHHHSGLSKSTVVGAVIGGVGAGIMLVVLIVFLVRRSRGRSGYTPIH